MHFHGWLFLVFLVLKLTGQIGWSWVWICAPIWGMFALWVFWWLFIARPMERVLTKHHWF